MDESHRRGIGATATTVSSRLRQLRHDVEEDRGLWESTKQELIRQLQILDDAVTRFGEMFGEPPTRIPVSRNLDAGLSSIWSVLEELRPAQLSRYGALPREEAERLGSEVERLLTLERHVEEQVRLALGVHPQSLEGAAFQESRAQARREYPKRWLYVEDEERWVKPLRKVAGDQGRHIAWVDPTPAGKGPWHSYPTRLMAQVRAALSDCGLGLSDFSLAILDIYYDAPTDIPEFHRSPDGKYAVGGPLMARELDAAGGGGPELLPIVFYSSKANVWMSQDEFRSLLAPPGRFYMRKLTGGETEAVRLFLRLERRESPPTPKTP